MPDVGSPLLWTAFIGFVLLMLALDLGVFHRKAHEVTLKEAASWTLVWVVLAGVFAGGVHHFFGPARALEFAAGYLIEKALSIDNVFVFVLIFSAFSIPAKQQHRVLFWGIIGALAMRAAFIFGGSAILEKFHFAIYLFGGLLVATGVKMLVSRDQEMDPDRSLPVRLLRRLMPVKVSEYTRFLVRENGVLHATPLLLALLAVEFSDVIFAVDSIPAIFAVTDDEFIVFTSNIFAILGMRSLYFMLAGAAANFRYLKVGLSAVLVFVGAKMLVSGFFHVPTALSLGVIFALVGVSIGASLLAARKEARGVSAD